MNFVGWLIRKDRQSELLLHTALSLGARIVSALSAFILSVAISQQLGAEEAGYYFLSFSVISFLAGFARVGLDNTVLRFTGSSYDNRNTDLASSVLKKSIIVSASTSSFLALCLFVLANDLSVLIFSKPKLAPVFQAMSVGIIGLSLLTLVAMSLQGLRKVISSVFVLNISVNLLLAAFILGNDKISSIHVAAFYSLSSIVAVIVGAVLLRMMGGISKHSESVGRISWYSLFQSCLPLWIVMLMAQLTQWSGQFIAGVWVPVEEIAQLAVAQRTAMLTSFILMAVNMVVAPRFAAMYNNGRLEDIRKLALISVRMMLVIAVPVIGIMLLFPSFLMGLFGEGFSSGAQLLQILAIGQFINVATGSVGYLLSMSGHEKDLRNTSLISGPIAVCSALILVPYYGVTGSAIATALAIASQNIVAVYWVKKRLGFNTLAVWKTV
jgi:O-antigen/teichoic acid export membrane protein